jgi:calcineurin-like phosphoesterase family protein
MNKLLKFKQTDTQKVYFVSDTHYNHNPKWEVPLWMQRGYASVEEMNLDEIEQINKIVRPDDILFHLGDISLNCNEQQFEDFIGKLNCKNIYLLWGNHNAPCQAIYKREVTVKYMEDIEVYPFKYKNIIFLGNYQEITVDGQYIVLAHYPISVFNYMKDGAWHLCGHSHYNFDLSTAENKTSKILDVGWEGLKRPYTMEEVRNIMNSKGIVAVDHHI